MPDPIAGSPESLPAGSPPADDSGVGRIGTSGPAQPIPRPDAACQVTRDSQRSWAPPKGPVRLPTASISQAADRSAWRMISSG